ncbi:MAG: hypothetical protein KGL39_07045 [Patescibacteria group bacterium]|nr:hypothetical protein [Patescibacteria group bacterium]
MIWLFLLFFVSGTVIGVAGTWAYLDAWRLWMKDEAARWEAAVLEEVRVLRAWKAAHIGKEATPAVQSAAEHSACQPARAERA